MAREYYVYIMTNASRTLYVGVTNDQRRRIHEHKRKVDKGFTARYNVTQLVYYEMTNDIADAIEREKQIKGWRRSRKVELIIGANPEWADLGDEL